MFFDGTGNNANNSGDRQAACSGEHFGMNDADAVTAYSQCVRLKHGYSGTAAGSYIGYYSNVHWLYILYRQDIRPDMEQASTPFMLKVLARKTELATILTEWVLVEAIPVW